MKTLFLFLLSSFSLVCAVNAQTDINLSRGSRHTVPANLPFLSSPIDKSEIDALRNAGGISGNARALQATIVLNYDAVDEISTIDNGGDYWNFLWDLNSRFDENDTSVFGLTWAAVRFDTLYDANNLVGYPGKNTDIFIDSVSVFIAHENVTGTPDSIRISVYKWQGSLGIQLNAQEEIINQTWFDTTIITTTSLTGGANQLGLLTVYPRVQMLYPFGKFSVGVHFYGDTANSFKILAGYSDICGGTCFATTSVFELNSLWRMIAWAGQTNLTGINTLAYNCNGNGVVGEPAACEEFPIQNLGIEVNLNADFHGSTVNGNIFKDANSNCSKDISEPGVLGFRLKIDELNYTLTTNASGNFAFLVADTGNYTIRLLSNSYLAPFCPDSGVVQVHVTALDDTFSAPNIALESTISLIRGKIYYDTNNNCSPDVNDRGMFGFLTKIDELNDYASSVSNGDFTFIVRDTGNLTVRLLTDHPYLKPLCPDNGVFNVHVSSLDDTIITNIGLQTNIAGCPLMQVDISSPPELRRCSPLHGDYVIRYCNNGTGFAINAYVSVKIPTSSLTVVGSSIPWRTPQTGSVFLFDIGDIAPGQCGSFSIDVSVTCDPLLGQTICVLAHIYPDTICAPVDTLWDGSTVSVDGECTNDTVKFEIENTGSNMQDSLYYRIIEDNVMLRTGKFKLLNGQKIPLFQPANGFTFRFEADQSAGHPGESHPAFIIEGCGTNTTGGISLGFVNTLPQDEDNPFIAITCDEIIGSYDPNDKTSYPKGVNTEKLISSTTELDYKIRFQNTGNDTAFKVVIRDTLSQHLDIASIELGASSHPYDFRIYGPRVLEWTFDNIMLADSFVNEPESHGFLQFRVAQVPNNPEGTVIENSADIYFDFNAPVKTNVEFNTVGDVYKALTTTVFEHLDLQNNINIYPNPFSDFLTVEIEGNQLRQVQFEVYDLLGKSVRNAYFQNTNQFVITHLNLQKGMYFYRITSNGAVIGDGKIIRME